ncbi:MAG TPA: class I SAM-dependent methyltransferase [Chlamydiales bacterium]|nr:class I SAM-dependent methyltransferase [Chlamydiales bacterium]
MQKSALEEVYRKHHEKGNRYGYLFCHGGRVPYLKKWIGTGKRVLDLGCRDGMLTQSFARGNEVVGVDIDQNALQIIQKRLGIQTHWLDLNAEWPFQPQSFDVIVACEILEHLFFLEPFLERIAKTLKPGGLFIGSVPNAFRMRNRLKFLFGNEFEKDATHVRMFSHEKLQQTLLPHFSSTEIIPIKGKILPFLSVTRLAPKALNLLFSKDLLWKAQREI